MVLLDTNVYVSAVKNPLKETETLRLIIHLLEDEGVGLVGSDILALELLRYAEQFPSATAATLATAMLEKMLIVKVEERFIVACSPYLPPSSLADCLHAATCLQTGAVLVSNDRDFDKIGKAGLVDVLSISEAIRRLLPRP
jgi:predicted nucleic acid-binding protein